MYELFCDALAPNLMDLKLYDTGTDSFVLNCKVAQNYFYLSNLDKLDNTNYEVPVKLKRAFGNIIVDDFMGIMSAL